MQINKKGLNLLKKPIPELIKKMALPASIGFFFQTMYNVVDTYFAGMISTDALAAMTLCFPLFIIILALGNGVGIGTSALVANSLGAKDKKLAKKYVSQSISFGLLVTIIITALGLNFSTELFTLLGATPAVIVLANQYATVLFGGAIFFILNHIFNSILMATGDTITFRNLLIIGFFANIILDPLFLLGWFGFPKMGLAGIAFATVFIQAIGTIILFMKVKKSGLFSIDHFKQYWVPHKKIYKTIATQSIPASFNHLMMAIGIFIITYFVGLFSIAGVAAIGIAMRVEQMAVLPAIGLNIAALSIVGQNNGAKQYTRVKKTITYCLKYGFIFTFIAATIIFIFAKPILGVFSNDPEVLSIALSATRIASGYIAAYVLFGISVSALQAIKKPYFAMWGAIGRQIIGPLLLFPLFTYNFNMGITGIFWAMFIIAWVLAIVSLVHIRQVFKKLPSK